MNIFKKRIASVSAALLLSISVLSGLSAGVLKEKAVAFYDLVIDEVKVNSANCKDILGNGVFRYEPSTQTLIINGDYGEKNTPITVNVIADSALRTA